MARYRYTPDIQKRLKLTIQPEPWLHILIDSTIADQHGYDEVRKRYHNKPADIEGELREQMPNLIRYYVIYVWDTREVIDCAIIKDYKMYTAHVYMHGITANDSNEQLVFNSKQDEQVKRLADNHFNVLRFLSRKRTRGGKTNTLTIK